MDTVRELISSKGGEVRTVQPDDTVLDAIQKMADHDDSGNNEQGRYQCIARADDRGMQGHDDR
jgi:hypothetical protein